MKIKFRIDMEDKVVKLYIKRGEMQSWVKTATKNKMTDKQIAENGSHAIALAVSKALQHISRISNVDVLKFKPEILMYKSVEELPRELKN